MSCKHTPITVGTCRVCPKCGVTLLDNNKVFFDRKLPNYKSKKKKGKRK